MKYLQFYYDNDWAKRCFIEDFKAQLETLNEELELLNAQSRELEATIAGNISQILEA